MSRMELSEEELYKLIETIVKTVVEHLRKEGIAEKKKDFMVDFSKEHLLTELQVRKAITEGYHIMKLGKHTILTPLAMDYVSAHNITIVRQ